MPDDPLHPYSPARRALADAIRAVRPLLDAVEERPAETRGAILDLIRAVDDLADVADAEVDRLGRERETAIRWATRLEAENAEIPDRAALVEALRGATQRVYDERREILPLRIERDNLAAVKSDLRRRLIDAESRVIELQQIVAGDADPIRRALTGLEEDARE